jgi:hypothetical protein
VCALPVSAGTVRTLRTVQAVCFQLLNQSILSALHHLLMTCRDVLPDRSA